MNEITPILILILLVLLPLLLALALAFRTSRAMALHLAPWAALPVFIQVVFAPPTHSLNIPWLLLDTTFGISDDTSRLFLLFTSLLWCLAGVFARSYIAKHPRRTSFYFYYLLAMSGNLGLILAQDMASFYVFFALMSFASYGLVVLERTREAMRAGSIYIILVVIGELALFAAMAMAMTATNAIDFETVRAGLPQAASRDLIILLALIGFGIKAGVLGLHVWLPLAHPVAPTPASAVLSGAMIKAGLLGWLRLLPLGETALLQWSDVFIVLGIAAAFYAVVVGLPQRNPKTVLAYSSISQMGIITIAVGLGLGAPVAYPLILIVITLYAIHHGLNKGALFLGVAVIAACHGRLRQWVWWALWIPALALAGAPLTTGMLVKIMLKAQVTIAPEHWVTLLPLLLSISSIATTLLVGRFLFLLANPKQSTAQHVTASGLILPWALLIITAIVLPWWFAPPLSTALSLTVIISSLWPVLLAGVLIAITLWIIKRRPSTGTPLHEGPTAFGKSLHIPPGDLLIPISYVSTLLFNTARYCCWEQMPHWRDYWLAILKQPRSSILLLWQRLGRIESNLTRWPVGLLIFVLLGLLLIWFSWE